MTTNHTIPATAAGGEQSGHEGRFHQGTRSLTPRLVPAPPPADEAREAATVADNQQRLTTHLFAWHLIDPLKDRFELRMDAAGRPLARLTIGGIGISSATLDVGGQRLLFTEVANRQVTITDASTTTVVADFEWQRPGRQGTLRFVEGGRLRWRRTSRWRQTFTFVDRFGNLLMRFHPDGRALGPGLNTRLEPSVGSRDDLTLLLALGWFLLVSSGAATPPELVAMPARRAELTSLPLGVTQYSR
jgi:hypothetical protein